MKLAIMLCAPAFVAAVSLGPTPRRATPAVADAAMRGDAATVRKLIAQRADVNVAQGDGMTALHWAAEHGDLAMTEVLLKAHAKLGAVTRIASYTPLHIAGKSDVGLHADNPGVGFRLDRLDRLAERVAPARHDRDVGARLGELRRDGKADALAAAGDDG